MTLRRKSVLFAVACVGALMLLLQVVVNGLVSGGFRHAEQAQMTEKVVAVRSIVERVIGEFSDRFSDWSDWDDVVGYLEEPNQAFLDSNISLVSIRDQLKLSSFALVRAPAEPLIAFSATADAAALQPLQEEVRAQLDGAHLLRGIDDDGPPFAGLMRTTAGITAFASRPVRRSDGDPAPLHGRLVVGRLVDAAWIARLRRFTFLDLSLAPLEAPPRDPTEQQALAALGRGLATFVAPIDDQRMAGFCQLDDIYGAPSFLLRVERDRDLLAYGDAVRRSSLGALIAGGAALAAVFFLLVRRGIVIPIERLLAGVRSLARGTLTRVRVDSSDEIGDLSDGFNQMADAIVAREQAIVTKSGEIGRLLDNMRQAIVAFDREGRVIGQASRRAHEIFRRESLDGALIHELILPGMRPIEPERQLLSAWLRRAADCPLAQWDALAEFAPSECRLDRGTQEELSLRLEFLPIEVASEPRRFMLLATDETEVEELKRQQRATAQLHARELAAMRRLAAGGAQLFLDFLRSGRERLTGIEQILNAHEDTLDPADLQLLFRHAHTLKGEARIFELAQLERTCRHLEDGLERVGRRPASTCVDVTSLRAEATAVRNELDRAEQDFVAVAPAGPAVLHQATIDRRLLAELEAAAAAHAARDGGPESARLAVLVERLGARPFGAIASPLADRAAWWAEGIDKRVVVCVEGRETLVPDALAKRLLGALTHLVRNAIAHGIETVPLRTVASKPPMGTIRIAARDGERGPEFLVADDGRGIDRAALVRKAAQRGIKSDPDRELLLLFLPGLSTVEQVDDFSGRGVGMDAVQAEMFEAGYDVAVETTPGRGTTFTLAPRVVMPDLHCDPRLP